MRQSDFSRFSTGCAWPDWIRRDEGYQSTRTWHYQDYANDDIHHRATLSHNCDAGCLLAAIAHNFERLIDEANSDMPVTDFTQPKNWHQAQALFFFSHLLVDLHQPLHVGRVEDKGGNLINIVWQKRTYSLHHWWDGRLLQAWAPQWQEKLREMIAQQERIIPHIVSLTQELPLWLIETRQIARQYAYAYQGDYTQLAPAVRQELAAIMLQQLAQSALRLEALIELAYNMQIE